MMFDHERHKTLIERLRAIAVKIVLIPDGFIAGAVIPCLPETCIDLLVGAGAGPEALIGDSAVKCPDGTILIKV